MKLYDNRTCEYDQAAWLLTVNAKERTTYAFFEAHISGDEHSPCGQGWYFSSYMKGEYGWEEYDGGIYWDYENATDLEEVIGETVPFREYSYKQIDYMDFENICHCGDTDRELELLSELGIVVPACFSKEKSYNVTITETLKRTVTVKANSREEALARIEDGWKYETHVLGQEDFKEVHFAASQSTRERSNSCRA